MYHIVRYVFYISIIIAVTCCKNKKVSLSGNDPVTVADFIEAFPAINLPFRITDTSLLNQKDNDSLSISYKIFTQFIPDSVIIASFGKGSKPKIYPIGKAGIKNKETYLIVKGVQGNKKIAWLVCFDKNNQFITYMSLLVPDKKANTQQYAVVEKNFTILKTIQRKNPDASVSEGKDAYILNSNTHSFLLIMTDALEEKPADIINPIDTLPRKSKFSADYVKNKRNYVSIRDSKKPGKIFFFIHIEQNNGDCTGELKGEAKMTSPNTAVYKESGDLCSVQFTFTSSSISIKELEACGSHRDLRCLFQGSYPRKKEVKQTKKKLTK